MIASRSFLFARRAFATLVLATTGSLLLWNGYNFPEPVLAILGAGFWVAACFGTSLALAAAEVSPGALARALSRGLKIPAAVVTSAATFVGIGVAVYTAYRHPPVVFPICIGDAGPVGAEVGPNRGAQPSSPDAVAGDAHAGQDSPGAHDSHVEATYAVGVDAKGIVAGEPVMLLLNGSDKLTVHANGSIQFDKLLRTGEWYAVTLEKNPTGRMCALENQVGTMTNSDAHVVLTCLSEPDYIVEAQVQGAFGAGVVLQLVLQNDREELTARKSATFAFKRPLPNRARYSVVVAKHPPGETCTVIPHSSVITNANAIVQVKCCASCPGSHAVGARIQCLDLSSDITNCGACGASCLTLAHASNQSCSGGACVFSCLPGNHVCDKACCPDLK